jgi:hypothetical protein
MCAHCNMHLGMYTGQELFTTNCCQCKCFERLPLSCLIHNNFHKEKCCAMELFGYICPNLIWMRVIYHGQVSENEKKECILLSLENFCIQIPAGHTLVLYFSWRWLVAKLHSTTWTSLLPNVSWSQYNNQLRLCCHVYTPSSSMWAKQHLKEVRKKGRNNAKVILSGLDFPLFAKVPPVNFTRETSD